MKAFERVLKVQINKVGEDETLEIETLRVDFSISKNDKSSTNKSMVSIYNLSQTSINFLSQDEMELKLFVGYETQDDTFMILKGDINSLEVERNGLDTIAKIDVQEGKTDLKESFLNKSYAKGTTKKKIIEDAIRALPLANLLSESQIDAILNSIDNLREKLKNGTTFSKKTKDVLDDMLDLVGVSWSIQNNEVVLLGKKDVLEDEIYYISPESGLIGSPVKKESGYNIETLLLPEIKVGGRVEIESKDVEGIFKIKSFTAAGSLFTNDWSSKIELLEI